MKGRLKLNKKLLTIGAAAILLLTGCGHSTTLKDGKDVVAKLDGKTITAEDLYDELKKQGGNVTLTNMIDDYILNKEYKTDEDAKSYADSQLKAYKQSYESYGKNFNDALKSAGYENEDAFKESLILEYKKKEATEDYIKKNISDSEIKKYYDDNIFGDLEVKHILISPNTKDDMSDEEKKKAEEQAKKDAEEIIKKLDDGEKFDDLAKEKSDDSGTASNGGKLTATYGEVEQAFWDAADKLKDNTYTTVPVETQYGYHIIYRIKQDAKPELSKVKDTIIEKLVEQKMNDDPSIETKAMVELRKKYKLEISDSDIKKNYDNSINSILNSSNNNSDTSTSTNN